jgi:hypothetical protein
MKLERTIENMTLRDALRCYRVLINLGYSDDIVPIELWQWQELAERLTQKPSSAPAYLRKAGELLQNEERRRKLRLLIT